MTARAGALTPIAKVSVQNRTRISPRQNSISTTSFMMGSRPAHGAMPLFPLLCGLTEWTFEACSLLHKPSNRRHEKL